MVALRDLHRRLYNKENEDLTKRKNSSDQYNIDENDKKDVENLNSKFEKQSTEKGDLYFKKDPVSKQLEKVQPEIKMAVKKFDKNKIKIIGGIVIIAFVLIGGIINYVRYKQGAFSQENITIEFQGNQEIKSGETFDYKLLIHNDNRVALRNTRIKIDYSEEVSPVIMNFVKINTANSFYIDIGDIRPHETKEYPLKFSVFSPRENQVHLITDFYYEPANFSSVFNDKETYALNIRGAVVDFSLVSQQEVTNGEALAMMAVLTNNTSSDFDNLVLEMDYPEGFSLVGSDLVKLNDLENRFKIPQLKANSKLEVEILGNFNGEMDSVKRMTGKIGILNEKGILSKISLAEETVKVVPSRIVINQEIVSGIDIGTQTAYLGNILRYKINFKNNSTNPLTDLILKETIKTNLINHSLVEAGSGHYDQEKQEITWRASDIPTLKILNPGESGSIFFDLVLKTDFTPEKNKTNQTITNQARIGSLNVDTSLLNNKEIYSEKKEVKVNTNLDVLVSGEFGESVFKNSGPIPLKIGEETTFSLKITLKNNLNKIEKSSLSILLPSGIIWKNAFHRSSGSVVFNERSNELKWELNSIDPQVGYQYPAEELIFQIGIKPQSNQGDDDLNFINSIKFEGFEKFVEKDIIKNLKEFKLSRIRDYEF